ncbi:methylmalonyl-CoA mutase family protein [Domibacillus indicus]|uniref:methylmalonyl-CoA mutase family protein n=1 Tax=Domibacillus indicus TaxID=1437523 RepID=UPI0006991B39|nr:methylmalonyl-CoA mutase family protein [Domibacillus indicus]
MRKEAFPPVSLKDWELAAEASLKGKPMSSLAERTAEGIELKPLYTNADRTAVTSLPGEAPFTRGFHRMPVFPKGNVALGLDPISAGAAAGIMPPDSALKVIHSEQVLTINTAPYHLGGANAVQELALALAEAAHHMRIAEDKSGAASKCLLHFAAGPVFFTELAKLRAFKPLWRAFTQAFGLDEEIKPLISVETSNAMMSIVDPHVNILRAGSAAFSAVIGSVDYLSVKPFDQVTGRVTALSSRISENIPRILKHEALLDKVMDPAGGSYYVEALTSEIGRRAWDWFADIEEAGGIRAALTSGMIQKEIRQVRLQREQQLAVRGQIMVGANMYANPAEQVPPPPKKPAGLQLDGEPITPVKQQRAAEPFESLRIRAMHLLQTGQSVEAGLICFGELRQFKIRADYAEGVLAAAGIKAVRSKPCNTLEEARLFIQRLKLPYYCICGPDEIYEQLGESFAAALKKAAGSAVIDIAGLWERAGADGRIASGDNLVEKLAKVLSVYEGSAAV